ncbi:hypothetical protein BDW69DRAFT_96667 [Aspergillus filifer]
MASPTSPEARGADRQHFMATLASLLLDALKKDNTAEEPLPDSCYSCIHVDTPRYALSDHLLNDLLDERSRFPSSQHKLLSWICAYADTMTLALESVSLNCLLIYLLRSPNDDYVDEILCILMEQPEHLAANGSVQPEISPSKSSTILPQTQRKLLQKLHTMFTDRERKPCVRRMAGKVLTEILYDSDEYCQLFGELTGQQILRSMLEILERQDIVLSFFASTIIRAMYHSGVGSGPEWELNGPNSRIMHCVQSPDAMEQFRLYTHCHHHHTPDRTRSEMTYFDLCACYGVSIEGAQGRELRKGPALLLFNLRKAVLISCGKDTSGWRTNYMTVIPDEHESSYTIPSDGKKKKRLLSLQIHDNDGFAINDKLQYCQVTIDLETRSAYDMMKIIKHLERAGISRPTNGAIESPSNRRSSSLVIPLDMVEDAWSETSEGSHHVRWTNEPAESVGHLDFVLETASERLSQSSLTELSKTPTFGDTSSPRGRDSHCPTGPEASAEGQQIEEPSQIADSTATGLSREGPSNSSPASAKPTEGAATHDKKVPENGPARNTRSRSSQNSSQRGTQNTKAAPRKNVLKPVPPNTQESLIFPRRRARGKLYTAPTKTRMVDWDEDLRASDRSVEPEPQKENDLTSVSSPSSSAPGLKLNESPKQGNRGSRRRRQVAKTKGPPKTCVSKPRKRGKGQARPKKKVKLLSPTLKSIEKHNHPAHPFTDSSATKPKSSANPSKPENDNKLSEKQELINHPTQIQTVTDSVDNRAKTTSKPRKSESSDSQTPGKAELDNDQIISDSHQGRGQTVAEKLIAALRGSITPSQHPGMKGQSNTMGHSPEEAHASPVPQNEPVCDRPLPRHPDQMGRLVGISDSWTADMSQERTMVDEMYPVAMHPIETPDVSQLSSFQNYGDDTDRILGKEDLAVIQEEVGEANRRDRRASYSVSNSSAEPRSTASTFEFYFTGKPPLKKHKGISSSQPDITVKRTPERITTKGDSEVTQLAASALKSLIEDDAGQPVEFQEPNTRITADKNGSPRVIQQANPTKHEHVTLGQKRHATSPSVQQPSMTKRMRGLNQHEIDATLRANETHHEENNASQNENDLRGTQITEGNEGCRNDALENGVQMTALSIASGVSEATATRSHRRLPFLDRLKENLKEKESSETSECSELPSSASTAGQEPVNSSDHEPAVNPKRYTPGVAPLTRAESGRIVAPELSKSNAATGAGGHMNWQTSLQELHSGMQRTLARNSEVSHGSLRNSIPK